MRAPSAETESLGTCVSLMRVPRADTCLIAWACPFIVFDACPTAPCAPLCLPRNLNVPGRHYSGGRFARHPGGRFFGQDGYGETDVSALPCPAGVYQRGADAGAVRPGAGRSSTLSPASLSTLARLNAIGKYSPLAQPSIRSL